MNDSPDPGPPECARSARLAERRRPRGRAVLYQNWEELLFLHWAVAADEVASALPPGLRVDTHGGRAWLGIVPFFMNGVRPPGCPPVPGWSRFLEINLRTYVFDQHGRPGVCFFSLDASHRIPIWLARTFFHLNYCFARISGGRQEGRVDYEVRRKRDRIPGSRQNFAWERNGHEFNAEPGSLEFFLTERYRLFAFDEKRKRLLTGKVHHQPYPLQTAALHDYSTRLFRLNGFPEPSAAPASVLASKGVGVEIYPPGRVRGNI